MLLKYDFFLQIFYIFEANGDVLKIIDTARSEGDLISLGHVEVDCSRTHGLHISQLPRVDVVAVKLRLLDPQAIFKEPSLVYVSAVLSRPDGE